MTLDDLGGLVRRWVVLYEDADRLWLDLPDDVKSITLDGPEDYEVAVRSLVPTLVLLNPKARAHARDLLDSVASGIDRFVEAAASWAERVDVWAPVADVVDVWTANATEPLAPADEEDRFERLERDVEELRRALAGAATVLGIVSRVSDDE